MTNVKDYLKERQTIRMKKFIVGLLMTAMICSVTACGGKNQAVGNTDTSAANETSAVQEEGSAAEETNKEAEAAYVPGQWDGEVYTNTSLGMSLTLPEGWQIGTQEEIDAVENAGQQVTGSTDSSSDVSNYELYIYNPNTGSAIAMMTEDLAVFGDVTAQEYAQTLSEQLVSYQDQGIAYNLNPIGTKMIGKTEFVSFDGMAEYQSNNIYQCYAIAEKGGCMITMIITGPSEAGQAECENVLASIQATE